MIIDLTTRELLELFGARLTPAPEGPEPSKIEDAFDVPSTALIDAQIEREGVRGEVLDLEARKLRLEEELAVLQARADAARPVVEANEVIGRAVDLFVQLDAQWRFLLITQRPDDRKDARDARAEFERIMRALGDHLGEEGGAPGLTTGA